MNENLGTRDDMPETSAPDSAAVEGACGPVPSSAKPLPKEYDKYLNIDLGLALKKALEKFKEYRKDEDTPQKQEIVKEAILTQYDNTMQKSFQPNGPILKFRADSINSYWFRVNTWEFRLKDVSFHHRWLLGESSKMVITAQLHKDYLAKGKRKNKKRGREEEVDEDGL